MGAELIFPKLVIFGVSGPNGRHLVQNALTKGHFVSAVVRSPDKFDIRCANGTFENMDGSVTHLLLWFSNLNINSGHNL